MVQHDAGDNSDKYDGDNGANGNDRVGQSTMVW